jgi:nitrous oxidase accessory protein NosD
MEGIDTGYLVLGALLFAIGAYGLLIRRNPLVQAYLYTPAHLALEASARMFPIFRQPPVLVDDHPLMTVPARGAR